MKIKSLKNLPDVYGILESRQEIMMQNINELANTLQGKNRWLAEIGDQLVYLKYYAAGSFQAEKEVMLRDGFSTHTAHMAQHESITKEMCRLLERIVIGHPSTESITDLTHQLLQRLKQHVADHDRALVATMNKSSVQPVAKQREAVDFRSHFNFLDINCYTA